MSYFLLFIFEVLIGDYFLLCYFQDGNCEKEESEALACGVVQPTRQETNFDASFEWADIGLEDADDGTVSNVKRCV